MKKKKKRSPLIDRTLKKSVRGPSVSLMCVFTTKYKWRSDNLNKYLQKRGQLFG